MRPSCIRLLKMRVSSGTRRIVLAVSTLMLGTLAMATPASAFTETFQYTGKAQFWTVPAGISVATFDLYGAQGGGGAPVALFAGGLGGRATAPIVVTPGAPIEVNIGGEGDSGPPSMGGFNGGGNGNPSFNNVNGGGGASDIRIGGTALTDRVLVAGGGGGGAGFSCGNGTAIGGAGGGLSGLPGTGCSDLGTVGGGGTQSAGGSAGGDAQTGSFGVGGTGAHYGPGGGGGWFGGGGGSGSAAGGGSGHGPDGTVFATGVRSGNGFATVSYTPTIDTLIDRVEDINPPRALQMSLLRRLNTAKQNSARACDQLAAFIGQVRGQHTNRISTVDADHLIVEAQEVRDSLNCGALPGTCAGHTATIAGTAGADKLRGTKGDDVIVAGGGDDRVVGLGGDDLICASGGADVIQGGGGDDTLRGGPGKDELLGGGGSDKCRGGDGSDSKNRC